MIDHLLNSKVTVYRPALSSDGRGGRTSSMSSVGTLRVKIGQPSTEEREIAARSGSTLTHVLHAVYGSNVKRGDEIDIGGARRLRVVDVVTNSHQSYARLGCEVVQGG